LVVLTTPDDQRWPFCFANHTLTSEITKSRWSISNQDIERYVQAAAQPGAMRAAINYYRAAVPTNPLARLRGLRRVEAPTLVIWGDQDRYLGSELAEPDHAWVPDVRVERIAGASHWLQADTPEQVNQLLIAFLEPMQRSAARTR
jgi:epoxide hydrolase 4